MKMHSLKCPECGASLDIEKGLKVFYCKYCGHKILAEDHSIQDTWEKISFRKFERDENIATKRELAKLERERIKQERKRIELERQKNIAKCLLLLIVLAVILFVYLSIKKHL